MKLYRVDLPKAGKELDTVVVIDVIRAFTTTAFAFQSGAEMIIVVSEVDEAFALQRRWPDALLMGEVKGKPIEEFDYGNSPSALVDVDLTGRTLIHRTSAGTQGVVKSAAASKIYVTGLCNARATASAILSDKPGSITLVETGIRPGGWGDEDKACADYLQSLLLRLPADTREIVRRVSESKSAALFREGNESMFPEADLALVLDIDRFDFVMKVVPEDNLLILNTIYASQ